MQTYTPDQIQTALQTLPNWSHDTQTNELVCERTLENFSQAFGLMCQIALIAEAQNHHPTLSNTYSSLSLRLSTHDAGGITQKDLDFAAQVEALLT